MQGRHVLDDKLRRRIPEKRQRKRKTLLVVATVDDDVEVTGKLLIVTFTNIFSHSRPLTLTHSIILRRGEGMS